MTGLAVRPCGPQDHDDAVALLARQGPWNLYLSNLLEEQAAGRLDDGVLHLAFGTEGIVAVAWFGHRGQLVTSGGPEAALQAFADLAEREDAQWRMFVGPPAMAAELTRRARARRGGARVKLDRAQPFYSVSDPAVVKLPAPADRPALRTAGPADVPRVVEATLALNQADLGIAPTRVDRSRLRDHVGRRVEAGAVFVLGPSGAFHTKVEIASEGSAGALIEGVFTFPEFRGQGLARDAVAAVARAVLDRRPACALHCAAGNASARAAYEAAGMRLIEVLRLVLVERG